MNSNPNISIDQIEDEIIEVRQSIIREMYTKGILQKHDLMLAINCIEVDCKDPAKCCNAPSGKSVLHFEIPQLVDSMGLDAIDFIGSADRGNNLKRMFIFLLKLLTTINIKDLVLPIHIFILKRHQMKIKCMIVEFTICLLLKEFQLLVFLKILGN